MLLSVISKLAVLDSISISAFFNTVFRNICTPDYSWHYSINQTWQLDSAKNCADTGQKLHLMFRSNIRMGEKCDFNYFDHGMTVGSRRAGLSISEVADLLAIFTHNGL